MLFKNIWRAGLPFLAVSLLSATAVNATFLTADPIGTKDDPNLYMYVGIDPVNYTDPTGMEVFLSTREVTPAVYGFNRFGQLRIVVPAQYHMFMATHADYVGDPNARIFSWGPTPGARGSITSGDPKRLVQQFAGTELNANDRRVWENAEATEFGRTVRIDADDDVAAAAAANVLGHDDYDAVPGDGANSNSGAYAAARDADRASGSRPSSAATPKPRVGTPGWEEEDRVERRCAVSGSRIARSC
jgi:hypothetical protein